MSSATADKRGVATTPRKRVALVVAWLLVVALLALPSPAQARSWPKLRLDVQATKLFDLGVADYNGDAALDVFSSNHNHRDTLLENNGRGRFQDRAYQSRFGSAGEVPGLNDFDKRPKFGPSGLYLWIDQFRRVHLRTIDLGTTPGQPQKSVRGALRFYGRTAEVVKREGATVSSRPDPSTNPPGSTVSFTMGSDAKLTLRARFGDLPMEVGVDPLFRRARILVGPYRVHPPRNDFSVSFADRHGVAWADLNQDAAIDSYIAIGGLRGAIDRYESLVHDELLISDGRRFAERSTELGVNKGLCRGRQSAIVDYDGDRRLDLFSSCERSHPILWRQQAGGTFGSRTDELVAVGVRATKYRWLDLRGDEALELLAVGRRRATIYEERRDRWRKALSLRTRNRDKRVDSIAAGDYDSDGDLDIFIASPTGNTLLQTRGGRLVPRRPKALGLPKRSLSASWVDLDNDSAQELHALPQGVYERRGKSFRRTGRLAGSREAKWATASFADLNGDGFRDMIKAEKVAGVDEVRVGARRNPRTTGDWIEVDLVGPPDNPQAIGARALLRTEGAKLLQLVGGAESSRWGQGHYRLYYGLGERVPRDIRVDWPDGSRTRVIDPAVNRRIEIRHPDA